MGKLKIGENPKEVLECDLALDLEAIPPLRAAIVHCEQVGDFVSRRLITDILQSEEEHVDWLETQLDLTARVGAQNYLQPQIAGEGGSADAGELAMGREPGGERVGQLV